MALTIGEFARITHLSVRTLRRYHEAGLLEPAHVDGRTGYRYYDLDQVPTAQVVHHFRRLGMPVREVGRLVAVADPAARAEVIAEHLRRLEGELDRTRSAVASLRRLLAPEPPPVQVHRRRAEAVPVAAVRGAVRLDDLLGWYDGAMAELGAALGATPRTGPPGGLYDAELFSDERGTAVVYVPVADPPATGRVHQLVLPPADLAGTVHAGPHDDIEVTYALLGSYLSRHALQVAGPVREIYHVGPRDTPDASAWRTEIAWPVFETVLETGPAPEVTPGPPG